MLIDTHCHLIDEYVNPADVPDIISRARDAGVGTIIAPCADPSDPPKVLELCGQYDNLFATVGIHPEFFGTPVNYKNLLSHPRVVGVGEIGLDYHYGTDSRAAQIDMFMAQLEIANNAGLPVAIHTRDAEDDTAAILCDPQYAGLGGGGVPGVMHCYTSGWDLAAKMLDRGFYFSASGIITFKNAEDVRDVFRRLPVDRIVIETDSPFCAPIPYRGKKCEPAMVAEVAKTIADIRGIPMPELKDILRKNTKRLYPKLQIK
ncbi:MAG: TatD family hydrolase [Rickettsiales bacterium]|jgi:TatD DNase family protein|nr:TatD family hydrolase [Rickettsiales bacterium]